MENELLYTPPASQDARLATCAANVRANPNSSEALSVFADVLTENEDPHGELIVIEGQLEKKGDDLDPDAVRTLIQQKTRAILIPVIQKYPFIKPAKTKGGFITDAKLSETGLTQEALKEAMTAENFRLLTALTTRLGTSTGRFFKHIDPHLLDQLCTLTLSCSIFDTTLADTLAAREFSSLKELRIFGSACTEEVSIPKYYPPRAIVRALAVLQSASFFDHLETLTVSGLDLPSVDDMMNGTDDENYFRALFGLLSTNDQSKIPPSLKEVKHITFNRSGKILDEDLEFLIKNAFHLETLNLWEEDLSDLDALTLKELGDEHGIKVSIKTEEETFY